MRTKSFILIILGLAWAAHPVTAQEEADSTVLRAIQLPSVAEILRERGVPVEEIEAAIEDAQARGVPPSEMAGVLEETAETVEETGPIENFGAFVQAQLEAGLRGRELAEAIRAEHARRGIGPGNRPAGARGRGPGEGGPPDAARRGGPPDTGMGDTMAPDTGRRGPMQRGGQGQRPDSMPERGGGGQGGGQGGQGGGQGGQGGGQGNGGAA